MAGRKGLGTSMRRLLLLVWLAGCATPAPASSLAGASASVSPGSTAGDEAESSPATVEPGAAGEAPVATPPGAIPRARLVALLDAGLGRFLGTVRVDAVLERGSFVGFRIVGFRDAQGLYEGVDLQPGDVVLRVNGSPIERPEQALSVWNALRVNSELRVEYVRGAERREIRYPIVD